MTPNHSTLGSPVRTLGALVLLALGLGTSASVSAQPIGFAHFDNNVYRIGFVGSGDLPWLAIPSATDGTTLATAFSPDDALFAIHSFGVDQLATIDPSTGVFDFIGPVVPPSGNDLTFGDDGRLWMVADGSLYLVDTDDATTSVVPLVDPRLLAIAFHQGTLYGVRGLVFAPSTFEFISIEPDLATYSVLSELDGYLYSDCYSENPWAMDFDRQGGLWVVAAEYLGSCITPMPSTSYFYYADPLDGTPGPKRHRAAGSPAYLPGLAIRDTDFLVEVPTLEVWGLGVLGCLLALGAWRRLSIV